MSLSLPFFVLSLFGTSLYMSNFAVGNTPQMLHEHTDKLSCPLDFDILKKLVMMKSNHGALHAAAATRCQRILQALHLVQSEYLRAHGYFAPSIVSSEACWASFEATARQFVPEFDVAASCGFHPNRIFHNCTNVRSKGDFELLIPEFMLYDVREHCGQSLESASQCSKCIESLSSPISYFDAHDNSNVTDCSSYPFIYAAALVNPLGPTDVATSQCLFSLQISSGAPVLHKKHIAIFSGAAMGSIFGILGAVITILFLTMRTSKLRTKKKEFFMETDDASFASELGHTGEGTHLVKYTYEEIRRITKNFSRENIIGTGKYGNVYKGILEDGLEVAVKRFKTCSSSRDGTFFRELEVISSVKHVNLLSLKGYCTAKVPLEGYQRIIVCELMPNGSLCDHLFGSPELKKRLSWPIRQKIALGMARGLAYLHEGARQAIIHRDIKAGNILLDENFDAKVADFGLAKFNQNGMTHLSTRLAGTLGYVAPEYAMYGKLTEGSDIYSFGVVLLEMLSGKRAILSIDEEKIDLLTDWVWSKVRIGRGLDIIEKNMAEVGVAEAMEQYVLIAAFCCHPCLHSRPAMDQVVKLLECNGGKVPCIC